MITELKDQEMNFVFSNRAKLVSYILMILGVIAVIAGYFVYGENHHARWWSNMLINGFYFLGIALGALFIYALNFATETAWAVVLRRLMEAVFSFIPYASIVMIFVFIGSTFSWNHIYHWMDEATISKFVEVGTEGTEHAKYYATAAKAEAAGAEVVLNAGYDELIANKTAYLNKPFFWVRTIIYLATFVWFGMWFRRRSLKEDEEGTVDIHLKGYKRSAVFLVIFAIFSSTLSWDWLMSIDTHWFSTLYGWYVFSGMWVAAMNVIVILTLYLISKGYLENINSSHLQDMGKWVFALSFLWSYLWFSQFLLIWYSNIPEEVTYFITRIDHFAVPFFGMFIINFALPMIILMSRDSKRNPGFLIAMGVIIFIGHYMNTFLLVVPGVQGYMTFGWLEIGFLLGFTGFFINRVFTALTKAPLEPQKSPYLEESLHHSI